MKRKTFIKTAALGSLATMGLPSTLKSMGLSPALQGKLPRVGIQLFSLPKMLSADAPAALAMLAEMGYDEIELYGPYPFSAESNKTRWASLEPMLGFSGSGYFGQSARDFKIAANQLGLRIPSMHTDLDTLENHMTELGADARRMGATYVTLPAIPDERRQTLDDYKKMAETFNSIGAAARDQGLRFAYHNHGYGLQAVDGQIPFETLVDNTDPETVFLEMDVFWTTAGRANPVAYLSKYKGRYKMLHLKDMATLQYFQGDGGDASQWVSLFANMAAAGTGVLDLEAIVDAALAQGAEHFFVEQDMVAEPRKDLPVSHDYLAGL